MVLVVNPKVPAENLDAFVRYARMAGGKLNYGSAPGIAPHFVSELFRLKTGTDIVHIPYKGAGPVITDLLAGQIDMAFNNKSVLLQLVKQGRLRPLAVTSARAGRNCPRSRPWSRPASFRIRSKPGGASSDRPVCRGRSSSASTARSTQPCNPRSCARALRVSASSARRNAGTIRRADRRGYAALARHHQDDRDPDGVHILIDMNGRLNNATAPARPNAAGRQICATRLRLLVICGGCSRPAGGIAISTVAWPIASTTAAGRTRTKAVPDYVIAAAVPMTKTGCRGKSA